MAYKIQKDERVCLTCWDGGDSPRFIVTEKLSGGTFFLYEADGVGFKKLGKANSPNELEEKFEYMEKLSEKRRG